MAAPTNRELYDALVELNYIPTKQLEDSFSQAEKQNAELRSILLQKDLISEENITRVVADLSGVNYLTFDQQEIDDQSLKLIPEIFSRKNNVIAFKHDQEGIHVAMANPTDLVTRQFLEKHLGEPLIVYQSTSQGVLSALSKYESNFKSSFEDLVAQQVGKITGETADPPTIQLVELILNHAYENKASDIHVEPYSDKTLLRFRIDGLMYDIVDIPQKLHQNIITRIKVMARLKTDEHQAAQDGKLVHHTDVEDLDVRVSIVPVTKGEKVVLRLLSEKDRHFSLADLGISNDDLEKVKTAYQKPYGMILSTGPTGSGKTTTLYSVIKLLNTRDINIMTIEDPVEYGIEGINQIQVNKLTDLTFAKGLRSIVRQDPDIILVGEIRDEETAGITTNAAMTGHLVLSTLHTNDAPTAIPRLLDMSVEPFIVASTVNVIIAQRLVRKICTSCRTSSSYDLKDLQKHISPVLIKKHFGTKSKISIYKGKGCQVCHQSGYLGRIGIFETLIMTDRIRDAIVSKSDAAKIQALAIKEGMTTMLEDGLEKVIKGVTTIDEVLRVTKES